MPRVEHTGNKNQSTCAPREKISWPKQVAQTPTFGCAQRRKGHKRLVSRNVIATQSRDLRLAFGLRCICRWQEPAAKCRRSEPKYRCRAEHDEQVVPAALPPTLAKSARMGHPLFDCGRKEQPRKAGPSASPTRRPGRAKCKRPTFQPAFASSKSDHYFLGGGAIASLVALATRNFTTVLALIWIGSPVCGLRPMRALR